VIGDEASVRTTTVAYDAASSDSVASVLRVRNVCLERRITLVVKLEGNMTVSCPWRLQAFVQGRLSTSSYGYMVA